MNWKSFLFGTTIGAIGGFLLHKLLDEQVPLSGETVLHRVKEEFKKDGPIDGSWMQMQPENYEKYPLQLKVYRGGITRTKNGEKQQFEFVADAHTGSVIDIQQL